MDITYLGHSAFKLRSTDATVVTDPYPKSIGLQLPRVSADVVTVSHQHEDHNYTDGVSGTARRDKPFIIDALGEYEVSGVSVFGIHSYHDDEEGAARGENIIYNILIDGISVVHLGDLGHTLTKSMVSQIGPADVVLCPVGGHFTIDPKKVSDCVSLLEPSYLIPMHYKTDAHDPTVFQDLITLEEFLKLYGAEAKPVDKLSVSRSSMPEELEVVVFNS